MDDQRQITGPRPGGQGTEAWEMLKRGALGARGMLNDFQQSNENRIRMHQAHERFPDLPAAMLGGDVLQLDEANQPITLPPEATPAAAKAAPAAAAATPPKNTPPPAAAPTGGPSPAMAPSPAAGAGAFIDVASQNPRTMYDEDVQKAHFMSRAMGAAGHSQIAQQMRDRFMSLENQRVGAVADEVTRQFSVTGDPSQFIAMYNHMVPNGKTITSYMQTPDGKYRFKTADGETSPPLDKQAVLNAAAVYKDPNYIRVAQIAAMKAAYEKDQALSVANTNVAGNMMRDSLKAGYEMAQKLATEQFKANHQDLKLNPDITGKYKFVMVRNGKVLGFDPDANKELGGGGQFVELPMDPAAVMSLPPAAASQGAIGGAIPGVNGAPAPLAPGGAPWKMPGVGSGVAGARG